MEFKFAIALFVSGSFIAPFARSSKGGDINYLGCWNDGKSEADKVFKKSGFHYYNWLIEDCLERCLDLDAFYFGLSQKRMCYCGNSSSLYTRYGPASPCKGEQNTIRVYEARCHADLLDNGITIWSYRSVQYQCNTGFYLSGEDQRRCSYQDDRFMLDGEAPICIEAPTTTTTLKIETTERHTTSITLETTTAALVHEATTPPKEETTRSVIKNRPTVTTTRRGMNTKMPYEVNSQYISTDRMSATKNIHEGMKTQKVIATTPDEEEATEHGSLLNALLVIIPVSVLISMLALAQCYRCQSPPLKRRSFAGESVCGPSSFEYLTPRAVTRQFSYGMAEGSYNKTLERYRSKDALNGRCVILDDWDASINRSSYDLEETVYV